MYRHFPAILEPPAAPARHDGHASVTTTALGVGPPGQVGGSPVLRLEATAVAAPSQQHSTDDQGPESPRRQLLDVGAGERQAA